MPTYDLVIGNKKIESVEFNADIHARDIIHIDGDMMRVVSIDHALSTIRVCGGVKVKRTPKHVATLTLSKVPF